MFSFLKQINLQYTNNIITNKADNDSCLRFKHGEILFPNPLLKTKKCWSCVCVCENSERDDSINHKRKTQNRNCAFGKREHWCI